MTHALVVGGTGMLREATLWLATRFDTVSVIARSEGRLQRLETDAASRNGIVNSLPLDYRDENSLRQHIEQAIDRFGEIALMLSWIHSVAPNAHRVIAGILDGGHTDCRWFDVLGSEAADPSLDEDDRRQEFSQWKRIHYRSIVTGFVVDGSRSRWLTNHEISDGAINAIQQDAGSYIIGQVHPWSRRPLL